MSLSSLSTRSWQHRVLLRLGGIGALCALVVLILGITWALLAPDESTSELLILTTPIVTPLLLLPTVGALYSVYRPTAPRLSRLMLGLGGCGAAAIAVLTSFYLAGIPTAPMQRNPLIFICYSLLLANGGWLIIAGSLEVSNPTPMFTGMGGLGVLAGAALVVFLLCGFAIDWPAARALLRTDAIILGTLPVVVITHGLWLAGTGYRCLIDP